MRQRRIHGRDGLVGKDHLWVLQQDAGDCHALLPPPRKIVGAGPELLGNSDPGEREVRGEDVIQARANQRAHCPEDPPGAEPPGENVVDHTGRVTKLCCWYTVPIVRRHSRSRAPWSVPIYSTGDGGEQALQRRRGQTRRRGARTRRADLDEWDSVVRSDARLPAAGGAGEAKQNHPGYDKACPEEPGEEIPLPQPRDLKPRSSACLLANVMHGEDGRARGLWSRNRQGGRDRGGRTTLRCPRRLDASAPTPNVPRQRNAATRFPVNAASQPVWPSAPRGASRSPRHRCTRRSESSQTPTDGYGSGLRRQRRS